MRNAAVAVRRALVRLRSDPPNPSVRLSSIRRRGATASAGLGTRITRLATRLSLAPRHDPEAGPRAPRSGAHRASRFDRLALSLQSRFGAGFLARLSGGAGAQRILPVGLALLVLVAALWSVAPTTGPGGTGAVNGAGNAPRIAVGGDAAAIGVDTPAGTQAGTPDGGVLALRTINGGSDTSAQGPYLADGTLLKPLAVDTTVPDGSAKVVTYIVKSGDTLTGIADQFGIALRTLWAANKLSSLTELHIGQKLTVPLIDGLVYVVKDGDTLASVASANKVSADAIVTANGLTDTTLIIGQVLVLPGVLGAPLPTPTPTPTPRPVVRSATGTTHVSPPVSYAGGRFLWPVVGGGNYISQYFWWGHPAIDIAAAYGSTVRAAAAGKVIWAGWRDNGGGYQVYVAHGSGLYTTYNHMSAITVGVGQYVAAGQQVGRIGMTGDATGPHLHFEVWIGTPWISGSYRVNPMAYF